MAPGADMVLACFLGTFVEEERETEGEVRLLTKGGIWLCKAVEVGESEKPASGGVKLEMLFILSLSLDLLVVAVVTLVLEVELRFSLFKLVSLML